MRLETWDGQPTYAAAVAELSALTAAFAAAEEANAPSALLPTGADAGDAATAEPSAPLRTDAPATATGDAEEPTLPEILLALARADRAAEGWALPPATIPPAPESLAWMATEIERQAGHTSPPPAVAEPSAPPEPARPTPTPTRAARSLTRARFGDPQPRPRITPAPIPALPPQPSEVLQLPLF